ncbi:hypothetical protein AAC387_Pa02g5111 [Persea americana]
MVMVRICLERMPPGAYKKLHSRNTGPYKILKKIGSKAYVLDLPSDSGLSSTFNVKDLTLYCGHDTDGDHYMYRALLSRGGDDGGSADGPI